VRSTLDALIGEAPVWELTSIGGFEPILDVNNSPILRGYEWGRFHEKWKWLESLELRRQLSPFRFFNRWTECSLVPVSISGGLLGGLPALSVGAGAHFVLNRIFEVSLFASRSEQGNFLSMEFGQEF
jgi:hypothetical protein